MKGTDIIAHAVRAEMPDMEQLRNNVIRQAAAAIPVRCNVWIGRFVPVTAFAVLLIAVFFAFPHLQNTAPYVGSNFNGSAEHGFATDDIAERNNNDEQIEFAGLPVTNHCLPQENIMASRIGVSSLIDILDTPGRAVQFWEANPVQAFAFVRVIETTQENDRLTSVVEVLQAVWSRERELPETITLVQHSGVIMCCSPYGEMMREGGVFLLPLWYNDGSMQGWDEGWFNWTYRDVLFEIDDRGLVWSRSDRKGFNRFDGRHTSVLTGAILGIINGDENFGRDIAHSDSNFGFAADESVLAIATITSSESLLLFPTGRELWKISYTMYINEILSTPTPYGGFKRGNGLKHQQRWRENWQVSENLWEDWEQNPDISVTETSFSQSVLNVGEQYLVFITPSGSDRSSPFTFFNGSAARINDDGTITPISGDGDIWNVFDEFAGYTVERLTELAFLSNTWHEKYAE